MEKLQHSFVLTALISSTLQETVSDGPVPWSSANSVRFVAEQVSHHPPSECWTFFFWLIKEHCDQHLTCGIEHWSLSESTHQSVRACVLIRPNTGCWLHVEDDLTLTWFSMVSSFLSVVSAFYAECLSKKIQFNAHIWTKSKFLGMSIGVHNIGQGTQITASYTQKSEFLHIVLSIHKVDFIIFVFVWFQVVCRVWSTMNITFSPSPTDMEGLCVLGYSFVWSCHYWIITNVTCWPWVRLSRSILTVPWVELGGECNISCSKSGYSANIVFHTKPFYGGKKHRITAEIL